MRCPSAASLRQAIDRFQQGAFDRDLCADLLRECCRLRALDEGRRLHEEIARAGRTQDNLLVNSLIQLYGYHGRLDQSRSLFQSLRNRNLFSWNMIISAFANTGHVLEAKRLFDSMISRNGFTWNILISAFSRDVSTTSTQQFFNRMPQHNVVSCNVVLSASARKGDFVYVHDLFFAMPEKTIVSWNTILDTHIGSGDVANAFSLFGKLPSWDVVTYTTMLAGFAQAGDADSARALFDQIPEPNVVSWNALMEANAAVGDLKQVQHIFNSMPSRTIVSWNELLQASAELNTDLDSVREIFDKIPLRSNISWNSFVHAFALNCHTPVQYEELKSIVDSVPEIDTVTSTLTIEAAAKVGNLEDAKDIFDSMTCPRNLICWNCMLQASAEARNSQESVELYLKMPGRDTFSCNTMLTLYCQQGDVDSALQMFAIMPQRSPVSWNALSFAVAEAGHLETSRRIFDLSPMRNISSWNGMMKGYIVALDIDSARIIFDASPEHPLCIWSGMIQAYAQDGRFKDAMQLFRLMDLDGTDPDRETLATILDACAVMSDLRIGRTVVDHLGGDSAAAKVDVVLGGSIVNMFGKCGCLIEAEQSFKLMPERNLVAWNIMVAAYAHNGHFDSCVESFHSMLLEGVDPDSVSLLTVLSACSHAGKIHRAMELFLSSSEDHGIDPTHWHYSCVIDLLGRAGRLHEAAEIIRAMPGGSDRRDESAVWQSFLSSCRSHGDAQRGTEAARRAAALEPRASSSYATLAGVLDGTIHILEYTEMRLGFLSEGSYVRPLDIDGGYGSKPTKCERPAVDLGDETDHLHRDWKSASG